MTIRMDEGAAELLDTLHRAGYAAYVVGGCVRDSLLGLTPHDWDLCTSALPQQVMELFGAQRCIPTGLQHGTVTVKQSGALYEITTFRTEGTYTDGRHPDEVHFVPDVREDLARRDFTINAMAYNEKRPCGPLWRAGRSAKRHRTGGGCAPPAVHRGRAAHPAAVPLAARFGFAIDPPTAQAAQELCAHLDCVSVERIEEELAKLLSAPAPAAYLDQKKYCLLFCRSFHRRHWRRQSRCGCLPGGCRKPAHPAGGAAVQPWRGRHPPHTQAPALLQCLD